MFFDCNRQGKAREFLHLNFDLNLAASIRQRAADAEKADQNFGAT